MVQEIPNLDKECFKIGVDVLNGITGKMIKDWENKIQKSLGVLEEDGIFAFYVYLKSENKGENNPILDKAIECLKLVSISVDNSAESWKKITNDIDQLLLAKEVVEKMLIYARYHAKSLQ